MFNVLGHFRQYRAPLLLLAIQTAPMEIRPTEDGTSYRLIFAAGAGQYETRTFSCSGDLVSADAVPAKAVGVAADLYPSKDIRVSAAIGAHDDGARFTGATGGVQVALERPKLGLGLGFASLGGDSMSGSYYIRLGKREGAHFRTELASPNPTGPLLGTLRMGVGWNRTADDRSFGYVGLSRGIYSDDKYSGGVFGEFGVPVGHNIAVVAGAAYRPSARHTDAVGQLGISLTGGHR